MHGKGEKQGKILFISKCLQRQSTIDPIDLYTKLQDVKLLLKYKYLPE